MPPRQLSQYDSLLCLSARKRRLVAALIAVPGLMPALAHAQLVGRGRAAAADRRALGHAARPATRRTCAAAGQKPATFVLGDTTNGTTDQDMAAKGSAEVRRNTVVIKADALHYDQDTDMADAYGQVRMINNGTTFAGPEAHMRVDSSEGYMTAPKYRFNVTGGSGSAERVDLLDNERSVFTKGTYTACACADDPAWYIKGSEFDFDTGADEGVAHNGVLFFQGVPVFACPWLSFPLSGDAAQRPLAADLLAQFDERFRTVGAVLLQHRAKSRSDGHAAHHVEARRAVAGTFRYLSPTYSGSITGEFLPDDRLTQTNRYALYIQHNQNFGNGFGGYIYYNKVSDNTYPEDLSSSVNQFMNGTQLLYQQEAGSDVQQRPVVGARARAALADADAVHRAVWPRAAVEREVREVQRRRLRLRRGSGLHELPHHDRGHDAKVSGWCSTRTFRTRSSGRATSSRRRCNGTSRRIT